MEKLKRNPDVTLRENILRIHNEYRALHDSPPLEMHEMLNEHAQQNAEQLLQVKNWLLVDVPCGINVHIDCIPGLCWSKSNVLLRNWYQQNENYNYDDAQPKNWSSVRNFVQMVWKDTKYLGIGSVGTGKLGEKGCIILCVYDPPVEIDGDFQRNVTRPKEATIDMPSMEEIEENFMKISKEAADSMEFLYAVPSEKLRVWTVWLANVGEMADEWQKWLVMYIDLMQRITQKKKLGEKSQETEELPSEEEMNELLKNLLHQATLYRSYYKHWKDIANQAEMEIARRKVIPTKKFRGIDNEDKEVPANTLVPIPSMTRATQYSIKEVEESDRYEYIKKKSPKNPTKNPAKNPTKNPTKNPAKNPSTNPTENPTTNPTENPTTNPTENPTTNPTENPTTNPTENPTTNPAGNPTTNPAENPTKEIEEVVDVWQDLSEDTTDNPTEKSAGNPTKEEEEMTDVWQDLSEDTTDNPTEKSAGNPTKNSVKEDEETDVWQDLSENTPDNLTEKSAVKPTKNPANEPTEREPTEQLAHDPTDEPTENPEKNPAENPDEPAETPEKNAEEDEPTAEMPTLSEVDSMMTDVPDEIIEEKIDIDVLKRPTTVTKEMNGLIKELPIIVPPLAEQEGIMKREAAEKLIMNTPDDEPPSPYFFYLRPEPDLDIAMEHKDEKVILPDPNREHVSVNSEYLYFNLEDPKQDS